MTAQGLKELAQTRGPKFGHFIVEFATPPAPCDVPRRDPQYPLNVDSRRRVDCLERARSGHSQFDLSRVRLTLWEDESLRAALSQTGRAEALALCSHPAFLRLPRQAQFELATTAAQDVPGRRLPQSSTRLGSKALPELE
jgi:hypothetical protein